MGCKCVVCNETREDGAWYRVSSPATLDYRRVFVCDACVNEALPFMTVKDAMEQVHRWESGEE